VRPLVLGFQPQRPLVLEASAAQLFSDGGLLVVREFDERLGCTAQFAAALEDTRDPSWTHSLLSMVRQRIYGLLADDEDQNDHDELRHDPVFKLLADRLPEGPDLAGQPTLSRFENAVTIADLQRLREVLLAQFLDGFTAPPTRITLDIDAFGDPTHGRQQLTFFHGFYDRYLPLEITCADAGTPARRRDCGPDARVARRARSAAGCSAAGAIAEAVLQPALPARPAGRRPRLHVAQPVLQGGRRDQRQRAPRAAAAVVEPAASRRTLPRGRPRRGAGPTRRVHDSLGRGIVRKGSSAS